MKKKDFIFCIGVIAVFVFLIKVPFKLFYNNVDLGIHAPLIKKIISGFIIIAICVVCAKKKGLLEAGGFIAPNTRNFLLLILPLLFPGLLFISGVQVDCLDNTSLWVIALSSVWMAALMEEVVFRGVIQGYLIAHSPSLSPHRICLITATFFSLMHLVNLQFYEWVGVVQQVICAFYVGLLFSALLFRTKSIWMLGLAHGMVNFFSFRCDYSKIVTGNDREQVMLNASSALLDLLLPILLFSPILIIYWFLLRPLKRRNSEESHIEK